MPYFVVTYRRSSGQLLSVDEFADVRAHEARARRLAVEIQHSGDVDVEIATLQAASADDLQRTHSRYFKAVTQLAMANPDDMIKELMKQLQGSSDGEAVVNGLLAAFDRDLARISDSIVNLMMNSSNDFANLKSYAGAALRVQHMKSRVYSEALSHQVVPDPQRGR